MPPREPGMRAKRASEKISRRLGGRCTAEQDDFAAIIDAEFVDLIREKESRMACCECGGLFPHAELGPASAHPEADAICHRCINELATGPILTEVVSFMLSFAANEFDVEAAKNKAVELFLKVQEHQEGPDPQET